MKKVIINKKFAAFTLALLVIFGSLILGCSENNSSLQDSQREQSKGIDNRIIFTYLEKGDVAKVKELLDSGVNPNIKNSSLQTPLMIAVTKGDLKMVKLLLAKKANMEVSHKLDGKTALTIAVNNNKKDIVQALIEKGANINHKDIYGETPLSLAEKKGLKEIAKILLEVNSKKDSAPKEEIKQYKKELHERINEINEAIAELEKMSTTNTITPNWTTEAQSKMDIVSANITIISQLTPPNGFMKIDEYIKKSFDSFIYAQKSLERIFVNKDQNSKQEFIGMLREGKGFLQQAEQEIN